MVIGKEESEKEKEFLRILIRISTQVLGPIIRKKALELSFSMKQE
mgnify:CR=1 FL=1